MLSYLQVKTQGELLSDCYMLIVMNILDWEPCHIQ